MLASGNLVLNDAGAMVVMAPANAWMRAIMSAIQFAVIVPMLFVYYKVLQRCTDWQACLLAVALIPLLSNPANYYYGFCLVLVMLAERNLRLRAAVALAAVLWIANGLVFYRVPLEFVGASAIAIALSLFALLDLAYRSRSSLAASDQFATESRG